MTYPPAGLVHDMHQILSMGMLFALAIVLAVILALAMFVHALRSDSSERAHGWLVVVPLLIIAGWLVEMLIMG